jgi:hypothetical protein
MTKSGFAKLQIVLLAIVISISAVPMTVVAYDNPAHEYPHDKKWTYSNCWYAEAIDNADFGHVWLGGKWVWDWRTSCAVETRYSDGSNYNRITATGVMFKETYNKPHISLFTSTDPNEIGAWPYDGSSHDYYQVGYALFSKAVDELISKYDPFTHTAYSLVRTYLECSKAKEENGVETVQRQWDYSGVVPYDASHWMNVLIKQDSDQEVKFALENYFYAGTLLHYMNYQYTLPAMPSGKSMSAAEMDKYGIVAVPINELEQRAPELGLSSKLVRMALEEASEKGESVVYVGCNPPVEELVSIYGEEPQL